MERIPLTIANHRRVIAHIVAVLKHGGVVVFPTETAYGLCADATNERAVECILRAKGRTATKGLSIFVTGKAMMRRYAIMTPAANRLWDVFLPGPLTIVVPLRIEREKVLATMVPVQATVGIRVSPHPLVRAIVRALGRPLTATSANISGEGALYSADDVVASFRGLKAGPDVLIDAGVLPTQKTSTVVDCSNGENVRILRTGAISKQEIMKLLQ